MVTRDGENIPLDRRRLTTTELCRQSSFHQANLGRVAFPILSCLHDDKQQSREPSTLQDEHRMHQSLDCLARYASGRVAARATTLHPLEATTLM